MMRSVTLTTICVVIDRVRFICIRIYIPNGIFVRLHIRYAILICKCNN